MTRQYKKALKEILAVEFASNTNLASYEAKTYKGAMLQANKEIKEYLNAKLIQQVPFDLKPRNKRQQFFYFATREGAKAIDRIEDYKQKITKSINNAEHESMKIDVAISFVRNFPDYDFDFNYSANLGGIKPDILIKAKSVHDDREYVFLVEVERKKEFSRIVRDKISRYNKHLKEGMLEKNNLPDRTKVLFVCSNLRYDVYLRPQQYGENEKQINFLYKQFSDFLSEVKTLPNKHYRFIPFPEFPKIAEPIWTMPSGTKVNLMD